jgi:hypothetical protein
MRVSESQSSYQPAKYSVHGQSHGIRLVDCRRSQATATLPPRQRMSSQNVVAKRAPAGASKSRTTVFSIQTVATPTSRQHGVHHLPASIPSHSRGKHPVSRRRRGTTSVPTNPTYHYTRLSLNRQQSETQRTAEPQSLPKLTPHKNIVKVAILHQFTV